MGDDTISRQDAIDALDKRFDSIPMEQTTEILLLRKDLRELPSAQPEKRTEERTETHGVCLDAIDRQAVIDTVRKIILGFFSDEDGVMNDTEKTLLSVSKAVCNGVRELPPAQPEIIRCKGCKHQVKEWRTDKRLKDKGYMVCGCEVVGDACGFGALLGQDDDYCSYAERRTDDPN